MLSPPPSRPALTTWSVAPWPSDRIRVAFALPVLQRAGVETWLLSLLGTLPRVTQIQPVAVAYCSAAPPDPQIAAAVAAAVPLISLTPIPDVPSILARDPVSAVHLAASSAHALIVWSLHQLRELATWPGPVIGVSHGLGDWWMSEARADGWVSSWAAVSRAAAVPVPVPIKQVRVIPNGLDLRRLDAVVPRDRIRAEWGLSPGDRAVGIVGRISSEKRHTLALAALAYLPPAVKLVISGDGPNRPVVAAAAAKWGQRVVFAAARPDVGSVFAALDAHLVVSDQEGFGFALAEGLATCVPTVSRRVGIVSDLERELAPVAPVIPVELPTPAAVAQAVRQALESPPSIQQRRVVADYLRREYSAEACAKKWAEYIRDLVFPF